MKMIVKIAIVVAIVVMSVLWKFNYKIKMLCIGHMRNAYKSFKNDNSMESAVLFGYLEACLVASGYIDYNCTDIKEYAKPNEHSIIKIYLRLMEDFLNLNKDLNNLTPLSHCNTK